MLYRSYVPGVAVGLAGLGLLRTASPLGCSESTEKRVVCAMFHQV